MSWGLPARYPYRPPTPTRGPDIHSLLETHVHIPIAYQQDTRPPASLGRTHILLLLSILCLLISHILCMHYIALTHTCTPFRSRAP
ncbi:hypothetical protein PLICRDRAFT_473938 [Plicaturopsis crispa FD-325 SS-3]|nr:hypothetical protein PLICRDRAFT_473938 [Plicaturopsis crispa FD-325 SS-3]